MNKRNFLLYWAVVAGLSTLATAQDGTFRTWFETPGTVLAGDSFEVRMWVSFESDLFPPDPDGGFTFADASFEVSGDLGAFDEVSPLTFGLGAILSSGTPDGPWLRDASTWQSPLTQLFVSFNPVQVLAFEVTTATDSLGTLDIDIRAGSFNDTVPWLEWYIGGNSGDIYVNTTDPNIELIATPASVRVIPTPGTVFILAITRLGASRRRR
jgi:hypothetical protein